MLDSQERGETDHKQEDLRAGAGETSALEQGPESGPVSTVLHHGQGTAREGSQRPEDK